MPEDETGPRGSGSAPSQHKEVPEAVQGRPIVTIGAVSACAGMVLLGGGMLGGAVGESLGFQELAILGPIFVGAGIGGVAGVWLGAWLSARLTGGGPRRRRIVGAGIGGTVGFGAGLGIAALGASANLTGLPVVSILAPGIGAAIGERLLARPRSA